MPLQRWLENESGAGRTLGNHFFSTSQLLLAPAVACLKAAEKLAPRVERLLVETVPLGRRRYRSRSARPMALPGRVCGASVKSSPSRIGCQERLIRFTLDSACPDFVGALSVLLRLPQADAGTTAVFLYELNAGGLNCSCDFFCGCLSPPN